MRHFLFVASSVLFLLIAFVTGMKYGQNKLKKEYRAIVGMNSQKYQDLNGKATGLRLIVELLNDSIQQLRLDRNQIELHKGKELAKLRSQKPVYVPVITIEVVECDSAKAVGSFYKVEAEALQVQVDSCKELVAVQDSAIQNMEAELIGADLRHQDDQAELIELKADLEEQKRKRILWRGAFLILSTSLMAFLII